jgi:hypothetical protein
MPAKSAKQKKLMDAAAHNPAFAKKVGIPVKVAKKFSKTSKGMKFGAGGGINRVGKAVAIDRRDPDIGKMIGPGLAPSMKHAGKTGLNEMTFARSKGRRYASGGSVSRKSKSC